jgi:murein DD-endopeptidase MepM/ murein hydrolase activator NlpD
MLLSAAILGGCTHERPAPEHPYPNGMPQNMTAAAFPPYQGGYRLPIEGRWKVARTHYDLTNDQAYAVDIIVDASFPQPNGQPNASFPSYGQNIVADGPGVVVVAVDGVPDNSPPAMNFYAAHGNYVVIDHKNGDFSLFAHLIPGSVRVRPGQVVAMGQVIALCGNSGNSSMAHLHYQVMDNAMPSLAKARPINHLPYRKNGKPSTQRLESGDIIEPLP